MIETPVAFIIFKRPDKTEKVFEAIRQAKPPQLFIIADGPRNDRPEEAHQCEAARAIIDRVDWDCEVLKNYSDINLGCAKRVSSGLDWVFENVEEAIILEDDCLPHPSFFSFCEELLEKYKYDIRVASISGQNVQFGHRHTNYSYYFSHYNMCWGWASWRRAWQHFDFDMKLWSEIKEGNYLNEILDNQQAVEAWIKALDKTYEGSISSWAFRWMLSCWLQGSLSIISNTNLISNIGFGKESTHTKHKKSKFANLPTEGLEFPLKHPPFIIRNTTADKFTQRNFYQPRWHRRLKNYLKRSLSMKENESIQFWKKNND